LLAPADAPLSQRAEAMFEWCRGFLGGFGLAVGAEPPLSDDAKKHSTTWPAGAGLRWRFRCGRGRRGRVGRDRGFVRVAVLLLHGDCVLGPRHRQRLN
jgi:uncharacterized protein YgfB (UPF0149 family)